MAGHFNKKIKKLKRKRWFLPATIGLSGIIILALLIGVTALAQRVTSDQYEGERVISTSDVVTTESGKTGVLYAVDDNNSSAYGSNVALESGYDTDNLGTGDADRLRELQEQIDSLANDNTLSATEYETDIRGKVDYNTLNSSIKDAASEMEGKLAGMESNTSSQITSIRTVIASNKTDEDNKLSKIKTSVDSNTSKIGSLENKVNTNANNSASALNDSNKKWNDALNNTKTELENADRRTNDALSNTKSELENADKKTNEALNDSNKKQTDNLNNAKTDLTGKIDNLGSALTTTINNNYTNITTGYTAVLIGTYDNSDPTNTKLILQGGK